MFNPSEHTIQISSKEGKKDYLPVQWRLVWFREQCPEGKITTELLDLNRSEECEHEASIWNDEKRRYEKVIKRARGVAVFKATVEDGKGGLATGTKTENAAAFPDYLEKAETGAIGRALAALGYGTQFAPDLDEEERIVDSPVQKKPSVSRQDEHEGLPATDQQLDAIAKLHRALALPEMVLDGLSFNDARALLIDYQKRIKARKEVTA